MNSHNALDARPMTRRRIRLMRKRFRIATAFVAATAVVAAVLAPLAVSPESWAAAGSLVSGTAWADTDRDGVRDTGEPVRAGVTVVLVDAAGTPVPGFSTTTAANGTYSFANVPDGDYRVRMDAPGAFLFGTAAGDNDFVSTGTPTPPDPQRGATATFTVAGASQHTGLDAGLQPISTLRLSALPGDGCGGTLTVTGGVSGAFDTTGTDGQAGIDRNGENCFVRTGDTVTEDFGVDLTNLPQNTDVDNVIVEFTIRAIDGAQLTLVGPNASGLPASCLTAGQGGANPGSTVTTDPATGNITVRCNVGSLSNQLTTIQIAYRHDGDTAVPSSAFIEARAYAAGGDAGVSNQVQGPEVFVTARAEWEVSKTVQRAPQPGFATIGGVRVPGFTAQYFINILQPNGSTGNGALEGGIDFTDQLTAFPNAVITACRRVQPEEYPGNVRSEWQPTCPLNEPAGTDGWDIHAEPFTDRALLATTQSIMVEVFIPTTDVYRQMDPTWQEGDDRPAGTVDWANQLTNTDGWAMNGGELNNGDGFEPGWDGTTASGNNVVTHDEELVDPEWDLAKGLDSLDYRESTVGVPGVPDGSKGYVVVYSLNVTETNGALLAPFVDDVTFNDFLRSHPNAILSSCNTRGVSNQPSTGTTTCETGAQGADGWQIHFDPSEYGISIRQGLMQLRFFVPMDAEFDPCLESDQRIRIVNEAHDTEGWTAGGDPINPDSAEPGTEPGWGAGELADDTATGNNVNVIDRDVNATADAADCGTITGGKIFDGDPPVVFPGRQVGTFAYMEASNDRVSVKDPLVCDVFDVSMLYIADVDFYGPDTFALAEFTRGDGSMAGLDPDDFMLEYGVGPNDTQPGTAVPGVYGSLPTAVADQCGTPDGEWYADPRDYGPDWQDHINMIRVRPKVWGLVAEGPFTLRVRSQLVTRAVYNGGPNAGQVIPDGVRAVNFGGWADRNPDSSRLSTQGDSVPYQGARIDVQKSVTPTQYFPGDQVIWDLSLRIRQAVAGARLTNVRMVDTLPEGVDVDVACSLNLLPEGVDVTFNVATREITFIFGEVVTTGDPHWVAHPTQAGAYRIKLCTTVTSLAASGETYTNTLQGFSNETPDSTAVESTIQIIGPGQLGIEKEVDKPYVASGETYTWDLKWGNSSTTTPFNRPDIIDVLPWNGDNQPGSGSPRAQYGSSYTGTMQLTGPLAPPTYTRGGTGVGNAVPGTWYYTTADPSTLNHDARNAANANPQAPGGLWLTAAEVSDFADVTGIRFVSDTNLQVSTRVSALLPAVSISDDLDVWYVNRASIFTATSPDALLLSNEPAVQIPGFSIGDLVWIEHDGDGVFTPGVDEVVPGVTVEVLDESGTVVGTAVTDAEGRWQINALPEGTYRARIPASQFQTGGPLDSYQVKTIGSSDDPEANEDVSNSNTETPDPASTGLTSTPITLSYVYEGEGEDRRLVGANGPLDEDVADLAPPRVAADFTNFTIDLALDPAPRVDIEKHTNTFDADEPTGPFIAPGDAVEWTYIVTNTGSTDLFDITVTDNLVAAADIDCGDGSNVIAGPLAIDESVTCVATGVATAGQYENEGLVTARGPLAVDGNGDPLPPEEQEPPVTDDDLSHYFGAEPAVDIEKLTNGEDADEATGPRVPVGGAVRWAYIVTNTGNVPVTNVTVTDDRVDASEIDCGDGSNIVPGPLAVGDSFTCIAEGVATVGQYANLGTVTAEGSRSTGTDGEPLGDPPVVTDEDWSHYYGEPPAAVVGGLAFTGGQLSAIVWIISVGLLLTGGVLFAIHRQRTRRAD